jgi:hypothetical protein
MSYASANETPKGRANLRERVVVEHSPTHPARLRGRRARDTGTRTDLFDLRRAAVTHNVHVIARLPDQHVAA